MHSRAGQTPRLGGLTITTQEWQSEWTCGQLQVLNSLDFWALAITSEAQAQERLGFLNDTHDTKREHVPRKDIRMSDEWLSLQQAADVLDCSTETVGAMLRDGLLCGEKMEGRWRIKTPEVERIRSVNPPVPVPELPESPPASEILAGAYLNLGGAPPYCPVSASVLRFSARKRARSWPKAWLEAYETAIFSVSPPTCRCALLAACRRGNRVYLSIGQTRYDYWHCGKSRPTTLAGGKKAPVLLHFGALAPRFSLVYAQKWDTSPRRKGYRVAFASMRLLAIAQN